VFYHFLELVGSRNGIERDFTLLVYTSTEGVIAKQNSMNVLMLECQPYVLVCWEVQRPRRESRSRLLQYLFISSSQGICYSCFVYSQFREVTMCIW